MIIVKNKETGQFVATQTSPSQDGLTRVSYEAYGETPAEAIKRCIKKWFGIVDTQQKMDDMDEVDDREPTSFNNLPVGFNPDNF